MRWSWFCWLWRTARLCPGRSWCCLSSRSWRLASLRRPKPASATWCSCCTGPRASRYNRDERAALRETQQISKNVWQYLKKQQRYLLYLNWIFLNKTLQKIFTVTQEIQFAQEIKGKKILLRFWKSFLHLKWSLKESDFLPYELL